MKIYPGFLVIKGQDDKIMDFALLSTMKVDPIPLLDTPLSLPLHSRCICTSFTYVVLDY